MKKAFTFDVATAMDIAEIVRNMRPEDMLETAMAGHADAASATYESALNSVVCYVMRLNSEPMFAFGVSNMNGKEAVAWGIGTTSVRKHVREFLSACPYALGLLMASTPHVESFTNAIPSEWAGYISWARKYLGAEFDDVETMSSSGHGFRRFVIRRKKV